LRSSSRDFGGDPHREQAAANGMSALGQKQTSAAQNDMSALHPRATGKADMNA